MPKRVWKDDFYIDCFELAKTGLSDIKIAKAIGVGIVTLRKWKKEKPALRRAFKRARSEEEGLKAETFLDYVYNRLSPELKVLWDKLQKCEEDENGVERANALLANCGKDTRQRLFLHALVYSNFNPSEACRKVNISRRNYENWITYDPDFAQLIDEMNWHKGNFFEGGLFNLVKEGDPSAVIFANRTYNRDRGYGERQEIHVSGGVQHTVAHVKFSALDLPLETRVKILDAIEQKKKLLNEQSVLEEGEK